MIAEKIKDFNKTLSNSAARLVAISKMKPAADIQEAYDAGQRIFGENKVQEMTDKAEELPKDIEWHMVGHLQRNKVKYIVPFVSLIHSVDSLRLLKEVNKQGRKIDRSIDVLLQIHIAEEESKFGLSFDEAKEILLGDILDNMSHIRIKGLMGMATNTGNEDKVREEFDKLKGFFDEMKNTAEHALIDLQELSMGMSGDYEIALECGSTLVRVGSAIFGERNYN